LNAFQFIPETRSFKFSARFVSPFANAGIKLTFHFIQNLNRGILKHNPPPGIIRNKPDAPSNPGRIKKTAAEHIAIAANRFLSIAYHTRF
jgi:hypothetical protein